MLLPGYEFTKGRGVDKIVDKKTKIRADGTEKRIKASMIVFMHFFYACIDRSGAVPIY